MSAIKKLLSFALVGVVIVLVAMGANTFVFAADEANNTPPAETTAPASSEAPKDAEVAASSATAAVATDAVVAPAIENEEPPTAPGNVTIDFKEANIQNVLRILSLKSGVNIVAGKDVVGNVTIRLVNVPWEKALDVVLKTYGYAYDRDGEIIRVTTLENLKREELSTEVFVLSYAQASEVEKSIKDVLSERGKVRSDPRSNMMIVTDMPTVIQKVRTVVGKLDKGTPQVTIETKVIETTLGSSEKLGIKWNIQATLKGASRPTSFPFQAFKSPPNGIRDFFPEGRGTQETQSVPTSGAAQLTTQTVQDFPTADAAHQRSFPVADKDEFQFGTLDFSQFQVVLEALKTRDDTKILSEPHIMTLNNKEAKILIGEVIAIPTFERNTTTGRMEITGYKDRDLGIRLSVTPQINDQDEIVVKIHPEITNLLGYDELTPDIKAPRFSTREAISEVRVKNGQTIVIGGLIKETTTDTNTKVPILGDLPLLDKLFSHNGKVTTKTDLLFFMTVHIVKDLPVVPEGHKV